MTGENGVSHLFFKKGDEDCRSYQPVSLTSVPSKIAVQIILEDTSKYVEDTEVVKTANTSCSFSKGKQYQTDLVALDDGSDCINGQGMSYRYHLPGLLQSLYQSLPTFWLLNWRYLGLMDKEVARGVGTNQQ